jgi:hypothetical protein
VLLADAGDLAHVVPLAARHLRRVRNGNLLIPVWIVLTLVLIILLLYRSCEEAVSPEARA